MKQFKRSPFFIVGCQRSGTTSLYHLLDKVPDIAMAKPVRPEPKFFLSKRTEKDLDQYISSYYDSSYEMLICGEKSTSYIESELALTQINSFFPRSKIIVMIRNPILRAISNYYFSRNNGFEKRGLTDALFSLQAIPYNETVSVNPFNYLGRGEYSQYLEQLYDIFGFERVFVALSEQLFSSEKIVQSLLVFLGSNQSLKSPVLRSNASQKENTESQEFSEVIERLIEYYQPEFFKLNSKFNIPVFEFWSQKRMDYED